MTPTPTTTPTPTPTTATILSAASILTGTLRLAQDLGRVRAEGCRHSLRAFIQIYLPHHAKLAFSRMHLEMFEVLEGAASTRGQRVAIAAPRGHAKSTMVSLAYILWCIVYQREQYIMLVSDTLDQASNLLSFIKEELASNEDLRSDFPFACAVPPAHARPVRWRKSEIITGNGIKVTALGTDSKLRGRKHNQHRPGLIVADDCENDESVRSPEQRERLSEWFDRALLKAGTPETNIIVLGTIFHYASLLARLTDGGRSPGWRGMVYQAVESFSDRQDLWERWESLYACKDRAGDQTGPAAAQAYYLANRESMLAGTKVLWPEREDYLQLMTVRLCEGRASFDSEKQNQPGCSGDGCFRESDFVFWDDQFPTEEALLASFPSRGKFYAGVDPSLGKAGNNRDDCAIVTLVKHPVTKVCYVLDADIRKRRPDGIIDAVIQYHRQRGYTDVGVESNQFQEFLAEELYRRSKLASCRVPVWKLNHSTDKLGRMQGLQPLITSGAIRLCRRHALLLDQLRQFPHGAHDDGPDALEMAHHVSSWNIELPKGRIG